MNSATICTSAKHYLTYTSNYYEQLDDLLLIRRAYDLIFYQLAKVNALVLNLDGFHFLVLI